MAGSAAPCAGAPRDAVTRQQQPSSAGCATCCCCPLLSVRQSACCVPTAANQSLALLPRAAGNQPADLPLPAGVSQPLPPSQSVNLLLSARCRRLQVRFQPPRAALHPAGGRPGPGLPHTARPQRRQAHVERAAHLVGGWAGGWVRRGEAVAALCRRGGCRRRRQVGSTQFGKPSRRGRPERSCRDGMCGPAGGRIQKPVCLPPQYSPPSPHHALLPPRVSTCRENPAYKLPGGLKRTDPMPVPGMSILEVRDGGASKLRQMCAPGRCVRPVSATRLAPVHPPTHPPCRPRTPVPPVPPVEAEGRL